MNVNKMIGFRNVSLPKYRRPKHVSERHADRVTTTIIMDVNKIYLLGFAR